MTIDGFEAFLTRHAAGIEAIARFSAGAQTPDDVRNEAWLQAVEYACEIGASADLSDEAQAHEILKRVRRVFDRERRLAGKTSSLDQPLGGDDAFSLLDLLVDDDGSHPLSLLETLQERASAPEPFEFPDPYHSEIAAWRWLLRRFHSRIRELSEFLMISSSWCWQLRRRLLLRTNSAQCSLPHDADFADDEAALRPWRKFKLPSMPAHDTDIRQATLDFWSRPEQPTFGQLWLL